MTRDYTKRHIYIETHDEVMAWARKMNQAGLLRLQETPP